ncbi:MAG TPA: cytochrome c [Bryobacteraceae bacterium]|nr:cytochrome c [Bryobacteraceae bacterium]
MWKKVVGYGLLSVVVLAGAVLGWAWLRKPAQRPGPKIRVVATPERLARGRKVWLMADCDVCHSRHDLKNFAVLETGLGQGNQVPDKAMGEIDIPNITPDVETGIGTWTDGEKMRAIREGVDKDGNALFPMMPYENFRHMSDEDATALVAYLDSLPPVRHSVPKMKVPFFLSLLLKGAPKPLDRPVPPPDISNRHARGVYLTTVAGCEECHTQSKGGGLDLSKHFAGGVKFDVFGKVVYSANITPDADTGIGTWSLPYFRQRFRTYRNSWPERFTLMPWHNFAQLSDEDIESIYYFLNEQKPVANKVNPFREQQVAELR